MYVVTSFAGVSISIPEVGEECSNGQIIDISMAFNRTVQVEWIEEMAPPRPFIFDGCSGPAPDMLLGGVDLRVPCLLHDIAYWSAFPDANDAERLRAVADYRFATDLILFGAPVPMVDLFLTGVRSSGAWWPGAKWGYGRK